jgi:hypothetical protein
MACKLYALSPVQVAMGRTSQGDIHLQLSLINICMLSPPVQEAGAACIQRSVHGHAALVGQRESNRRTGVLGSQTVSGAGRR